MTAGVTISMVLNAVATDTRDVGVEAITGALRCGKWQKPVEHIRRVFHDILKNTGDRQKAKKAVDADKKRLPGVLFSGQFSRRANDALIRHSGLICADLDGLGQNLADVRSKILKSPYLVALFLSPTADGLKAVFRVSADPSKHLGSFRAVKRHIFELAGVKIDDACKDVARLCFMSHDPELYVSDNAVEILPLLEPEKPKNSSNGVVNLSERQRISTEVLGEMEWQSKTSGYGVCPGKHLHTTSDGKLDCRIDLDGVPTVHCFHDSCRAILDGVNHELRSRIAKAEYEPVRQSEPSTSAQWQDPLPLPVDLPTVPAFDFACLPDPLRPWIEDISDRMQCPSDFPAVAAMVEIGSVLGRKLGIRPKRHDDWVEIPNLWGFVVGRPGLLKTPSLQQARIPLARLIAEALKQYEAALCEHNIAEMLRTGRKKLAERKIVGLLKDGDERAARTEAAAHLEEKCDRPICRRYEVNDSTIEKLGELLAENPNGVLLYRDELSGFLRSLDREDRAGDRAKYLEMWDGKGELTYDRIGRGTVRIPSNTLSILGGIQPHILMTYVREAVHGAGGGDGLLQRFQLAVWPDVSKPWRNVDRWPDIEAKNAAFALFKYLDLLQPENVDADASDAIPFLRFKADAQERFDVWRTDLENKLRSDSEHPAFEAHLAKYRKLVPALALLIHIASRGVGSVSLVALEKALLWANYLEPHARRVYSAALRPDTVAARELAKHLQRGDLTARFTLREIYRKGWTGLSSKEEAETAAQFLCDLGWIRIAVDASARPSSSSGRPASQTFEINPKIAQCSLQRTDKTDKTHSVGCVTDQLGHFQNLHDTKTGLDDVDAFVPAEISDVLI